MPGFMVRKAAVVGLGRIGSLLEDDRLREKPCTHAGAAAANPGLILCAGKDDAIVEYALSRSMSPSPVADCQLHLPDKTLLENKLLELKELAEIEKSEADE